MIVEISILYIQPLLAWSLPHCLERYSGRSQVHCGENDLQKCYLKFLRDILRSGPTPLEDCTSYVCRNDVTMAQEKECFDALIVLAENRCCNLCDGEGLNTHFSLHSNILYCAVSIVLFILLLHEE
jgi:hypothetical protein